MSFRRLGAAVPPDGLTVGGGGPPAPHAPTHENGGTDEINVGGLSGVLADPQIPIAHAATHENGGSDEIDVTGLSGLLADPQTPLAHASSHENGGADEIDVSGLSGILADPQFAFGIADLSSFSGGISATGGATYLTKVSIVIPAVNATFRILAFALISGLQNTPLVLPQVRLRNVTDGVDLGQVPTFHTNGLTTIEPCCFGRTFVQTAAAGAKTIAMQYHVGGGGGGTIEISDALITATRMTP